MSDMSEEADLLAAGAAAVKSVADWLPRYLEKRDQAVAQATVVAVLNHLADRGQIVPSSRAVTWKTLVRDDAGKITAIAEEKVYERIGARQ